MVNLLLMKMRLMRSLISKRQLHENINGVVVVMVGNVPVVKVILIVWGKSLRKLSLKPKMIWKRFKWIVKVLIFDFIHILILSYSYEYIFNN